jgi:formate-dependent nitrite reductase membrane component NrfD
LAGASSVLSCASALAGDETLARHARRASMIGLLPSPVFLIADLGRPSRFYNMLRVFKPTSPMSVGSWLLAAYSPAAGGAWMLGELGRLPRVANAAGWVAAAVGPLIATYTAVLVTDTATPVWHESGRELPFVFAASATASAGAATAALSAIAASPSRVASRVATTGVVAELAVAAVMKRRLGGLDTYSGDPAAHRFTRAATVLSSIGAAGLVAATVLGRGRRAVTIGSALAVLAGSACERFAVLRAGTASALDPESVLIQQGSRGRRRTSVSRADGARR